MPVPALGADFRRLWAAVAASQAGAALAMGAFAFVATEVLFASSFQVSVLAAAGTAAALVLGLPVGPWVELRRKRPVLIAADLIRAVALLSVPAAHLAGVLTYTHLLLVAAVAGFGQLLNLTASTAHLKALVAEGQRTAAVSRIDTTSWIASTSGPPLGGLLLGLVGATVTLGLNAVAHLVSAFTLSRIRTPEPPPTPRPAGYRWVQDLTTGWRYIFGHATLRPLFVNAMVFGAMLMGVQPLILVFMLRDLGFTPFQYGLALGLPAAAGLAGAVLAPHIERRWGRDTGMVALGALRAVWLVPIAFAPPGLGGVAVIVVCDAVLLFFAGAFNPLFAAHRMGAVPDELMARVSAAWSISNRVLWPIVILVLGALATATSTQTAILVSGLVLAVSGVLLPWHLVRRPRAGT